MGSIRDWLLGMSPIWMALIATTFTWGITAMGAATVFFTRTVNQKLLDAMLGFAAGVMIAASYWSLLAPAIEMSEEAFLSGESTVPSWVPAAVGFMAGALFLFAIDKVLPHLHIGFRTEEAEGIKTTWHRSILLVLAITLHNFPEGLAVGVAFGALAYQDVITDSMLAAPIALAIGIGLQNFPEGLAVSMPLRREGFSRRKSFFYGQLSAVVEPIAGVLGAIAVLVMQPLLPYALSFAAGAMIFVVVEELIPESHRKGNTDLATMGAMVGFTVMMVLDVALG
ncbi:MAG: ZIP family metal transporter [Bacteroidetes bacterium]|jgi:ZIP family zinc transporter|nr:ZIP family metal transporter [Bacteroidota bacterium]